MKKSCWAIGCLVLSAMVGVNMAAAQDEAAQPAAPVVQQAPAQPAPVMQEAPPAEPAAEKVPPITKKARLAVLPAVFSQNCKPEIKTADKLEISGLITLKAVFTRENESRMESPSLTLSLVEAFVGSRKFDVLERARLTETLKEIDFGESTYADVQKVVPIGKALNAEYVAIPEIVLVHVEAEARQTPYVDTVQPILRGRLIARLRVVDTASTKVVAAFSDETQVERRLKANQPFLATEGDVLVKELYRTASMRMLQRTLEAIYPVRILEVQGGKVVLNRGEGAVQAGDQFDVFVLGKTFTDPDTGENLGNSESKVATVKVVRVAPKFSEADVVEGAEKLTGDVTALLCRETVKSIESKTKVSTGPAW